MARLGVNIDHVATIREARKSFEPDPVAAAVLATLGGADGITIHLRGDRRHINERDLRFLREIVKTHLNLEMAVTTEMVKLALEVRPEAVCLVPERKEEITTEGGLDILKVASKLKRVIPQLAEAGILVTGFIEPEEKVIKACQELGFQAIEINTKSYSEAKGWKALKKELLRIEEAAKLAKELGLEVHAGHGLNYWNVSPIVSIREIVELNIGHSIISRAVLVGLERAVKAMAELVHQF